MNRRSVTVLAIIALILIAVFAITQWQRSAATTKLLGDLPGDDYSKVMDAMTQLKDRGSRIVPALVGHLQGQAPAARWRAAILLGEVGNRSAWQPLTGALSDKTPEVRGAAAMSLAKLGARDSAPQICALLADVKQDVGVRISAARALGLLQDRGPDTAQALKAAISERLIAFEALAGTAWAALKAAQDALNAAKLACLSEIVLPPQPPNEPPMSQDQIAKAKADKKKANETAVVTAKDALAKAETAFKEANATLVSVDGKALVAPVAPPEPVAPAPAVPGAAPAPAPAAPVVTPPPAADTTWELRAAAATALGIIGDPEAVTVLAESLNQKTEPNAEVRTAVAYAARDLARSTQQEKYAGTLIQALLDAQKDKIGDVRAAALLALASAAVPALLQPKVEEALNAALDDDFYWAREAARKTMKSMNMPVPEA